MVAISASGMEEKKYRPLMVRAPDGVTIAAQEWGNPAGPEILFIHGFSQASLSWQRQVESDLAKDRESAGAEDECIGRASWPS